VFTGEYQHSLDAKGRIILPSRIRSQLESGLVISRGLDRCLWIMAQGEWTAWAEGVQSQPRMGDQRFREFLRFTFSGAHEDRLDKQGRVTVPEHLRDWAGLDRDITVIGTGRRIEVWNRERWAERLPEAEAAMQANLADLPL
jgi:MraZ protein